MLKNYTSKNEYVRVYARPFNLLHAGVAGFIKNEYLYREVVHVWDGYNGEKCILINLIIPESEPIPF